jgi:GT2 family glycosyltransferase
MKISVVIATFNRGRLLEECLAHLRRQEFEPGDEVIVVDNGSTDATLDVLETARTLFPVPLRVMDERRPGKSRAIARGVAAAGGDVLAFTDDDVNVGADWLPAIRRAMADPSVGLVGGPVAPRWERKPPGWLRAAGEHGGRLASPLAILTYGSETIELGPRTAIGANMAVRRAVFLDAGGFAAHLGKLRGTLLSGEDQDLCRRVQDAGWKAIYVPTARVFHYVPERRMRVSYFLWWFFWSGITNAAIDEADRRGGRTLLGLPLYLLRRASVSGAGAIASAACGNAAQAIERVIDVAFAAGYATRRWHLPPARIAVSGGSGERS